MNKQRIFVAGHRGMVGSAIVRQLAQRGDVELVLRTRDELDLLDGRAVQAFFAGAGIDRVYLAAAKVGGIVANNTYPADFIYENMMIESNIIHAAHLHNVNKLLFLGSSCIYPKLARQPMAESELLQGTLEPTNEPYAIAKIAGIKLCESYNRQYGRDYRSVMPTNLYGPHDNFHPDNSHVIPALLRRFHEAAQSHAPEVVVWGSGTPMREFLHVDDMAAASIHVMELAREVWQENTAPMLSHINVGTGVDCTIRELAQTIAKVVGYRGRVVFDAAKPDGTPRKLLDVTRLHQLAGITKFHWRQGLPVLTSGSLRISNGSGVTMFLRQEDFAAVVRATPLISLDFIVENGREILLGQRLNRPAQGYWFVPGAGVQRRNAGGRLCTPDAGGTGRASAAGGRDVLWRLAALL